MSIVDNFRGKTSAKSPGTPQAPAIAEQLEQAQATLADLEARRDQASLDALADAPGAKDALAKLDADVKAARSNIDMLASAHRGAVERDRIELLRQQQEYLETAQKSVTSSLALRDKAADLYAAAIAEAQKHYRAMHKHNDAAYRAWTATGMTWPNGAVSETDLQRMASDEGWRNTTGDLAGDPFALPGPAYSKLEYKSDPARITRIDNLLREDSAYIKGQIAKTLAKIATKGSE